MNDVVRITTVIPAKLGDELRELALAHDAALSRLVGEAVAEYLARRSADPAASLLAQRPRREGRPSRVDLDAERRAEDGLRKRAGRPLVARRVPG